MESRIDELEVRSAHQELAIETLLEQLREQQQRIDALHAQVRYLYEQLQTLAPSEVAPASEEMPPPHY